MSIRHGIRYRLSVVLLLATLNSVALFALAVVLFSALADSPPRDVLDAVLRMQAMVDATQELALTGDLADPAVRKELAWGAEAAGPLLQPVAEHVSSVVADLESWQRAMDRYLQNGALVGTEAEPAPAVLGDDLARLLQTHRHLRGTSQLAIASPRPVWVEQVLPWLPWGVAWVVLVGAITVVAAGSLHGLLYRPLLALAEASNAVARGELGAAIPEPTGAPEIAALAVAMRQARDNLVASLHEQEARSARESAILAHMSDGVLLVDPTGIVLQINPRAETLLWQVVPTGVEPRVGVRVQALAPELDETRLRRREAHELELSREGGPGRPRVTIRVGLRPVPSLQAGAPGGWVLMLRDISAERELERLQLEFLSVVTHELKTPLTAIDGYARLLLRGKAGELQPRQVEFVETIASQSAVLKSMVQNLLDTSRLESGRLPVEIQRVDLGSLMGEVEATWRGGATSREIALAAETAGTSGVEVLVDPFRFQQVLGNLVGNALKFTPRGGRITLRARVEGEASSQSAVIEVEDTGRGIGADKLDRVFEKFFQVERADTRLAGGSGLGLYICRQLIETMGGRIAVRSVVDVGSTFIIHLPVAGSSEHERT